MSCDALDGTVESAAAWRRPWSLNSLWPLAAAILILIVVVLAILMQSLRLTGGSFTYALDDSYIHMSLAKNYVRHGVLGVTPFEFTSASSSPLWTLVLVSVFSVIGVQEIAPFLLCIAMTAGVLLLANFVMFKGGLSAGWRLSGLLWIIFATPMAPIIFGGMEHPAQILVDLGLVSAASFALSKPTESFDRSTLVLVGFALLATAVRYEGIVLVGVVCAAYLARGRWRTAALLLVAATMPVTLFGLYSLSQGGYFLPNSVLIKGSISGIGLLNDGMAALVSAASNVRHAYPLVAMMTTSLAISLDDAKAKRLPFWRASSVFSAIAVSVAILHLALGSLASFYRYEAYLFVLVSAGLLLQVHESASASGGIRQVGHNLLAWMVIASLLIAAVGGIRRGYTAVRVTPLATRNIYEQQVQMARFVKSNEMWGTVVLNDLGAITFYNDSIRVVDLIGLGMRRPEGEMLEAHGGISESRADQLSREAGARIAMVYADWVVIPEGWTRVGTWTISDNIVCGDDEVSFFAVPPTDPREVSAALRRYSEDRLPASVRHSLDSLP